METAVEGAAGLSPVAQQVMTVSYADFLKRNEDEDDDMIYV
jgi:hypothetical protein